MNLNEEVDNNICLTHTGVPDKKMDMIFQMFEHG